MIVTIKEKAGHIINNVRKLYSAKDRPTFDKLATTLSNHAFSIVVVETKVISSLLMNLFLGIILQRMLSPARTAGYLAMKGL